LLLIQVCSDPTPMHCNPEFGKIHLPLSSAALQNSLTACLCHCNYTHKDLLFIQVCSDPIAMHCSTGQGKLHSPLFSAALQNRLPAGLGHSNYTYGDLLFYHVCAVTQEKCTAALGRANCVPHSAVLLCKTGSQLVWVIAITPMKICSFIMCVQ